MHIIHDAFGQPLFCAALDKTMTTINSQPDPQQPEYFLAQSERLDTLLTVVVDESKVATNPDALVDYLELVELLSGLLDDARFFGILDPEQLGFRDQEVRKFMDKIRAVQEIVGDWEERTQKVAKPSSRKRARSVNLEDDINGALKRQRRIEIELDVTITEATVDSPVTDVLPSIENSPTPWWMEPFYD